VSSTRLENFRAMAAKDPTNALVQYGLANELVKAEEFAEARATLDAYLGAHDDEGAAYRLLALACEKLGDVEGARDAYRRGIAAAGRHGHGSMVAEYEMKLEDLE
jgi:predicted Zn-dependent protease